MRLIYAQNLGMSRGNRPFSCSLSARMKTGLQIMLHFVMIRLYELHFITEVQDDGSTDFGPTEVVSQAKSRRAIGDLETGIRRPG
jgi:hypothetical protein